MAITTSDMLSTIVDDIREKATELSIVNGVGKHLVREVGMGSKGNSVTIPIWDPRDLTADVLTEGVAIVGSKTYNNTEVNITATEIGQVTTLTKNDVEDATDDVKNRHANAHGLAVAKKDEELFMTCATAFTGVYDTSAASMTDIDVAVAKARLETVGINGEGNTALVVSPGVWLGIMKSLAGNSNFGVKGDAGNEVMKKYQLAQLFGDVDIYNCALTFTNTATHNCSMFKKDAIGMFVPRDFEITYDEVARLRGTDIVSTKRVGYGIKSDELGLKIVAKNDAYVVAAG